MEDSKLRLEDLVDETDRSLKRAAGKKGTYHLNPLAIYNENLRQFNREEFITSANFNDIKCQGVFLALVGCEWTTVQQKWGPGSYHYVSMPVVQHMLAEGAGDMMGRRSIPHVLMTESFRNKYGVIDQNEIGKQFWLVGDSNCYLYALYNALHYGLDSTKRGAFGVDVELQEYPDLERGIDFKFESKVATEVHRVMQAKDVYVNNRDALKKMVKAVYNSADWASASRSVRPRWFKDPAKLRKFLSDFELFMWEHDTAPGKRAHKMVMKKVYGTSKVKSVQMYIE